MLFCCALCVSLFDLYGMAVLLLHGLAVCVYGVLVWLVVQSQCGVVVSLRCLMA